MAVGACTAGECPLGCGRVTGRPMQRPLASAHGTWPHLAPSTGGAYTDAFQCLKCFMISPASQRQAVFHLDVTRTPRTRGSLSACVQTHTVVSLSSRAGPADVKPQRVSLSQPCCRERCFCLGQSGQDACATVASEGRFHAQHPCGPRAAGLHFCPTEALLGLKLRKRDFLLLAMKQGYGSECC